LGCAALMKVSMIFVVEGVLLGEGELLYRKFLQL
jgi:hypothetical protein